MFADDYPILDVDSHLDNAADWLDGARTATQNAYADVTTGETFPWPRELEEAMELAEKAWELTCRARKAIRELVKQERQKADEADRS